MPSTHSQELWLQTLPKSSWIDISAVATVEANSHICFDSVFVVCLEKIIICIMSPYNKSFHLIISIVVTTQRGSSLKKEKHISVFSQQINTHSGGSQHLFCCHYGNTSFPISGCHVTTLHLSGACLGKFLSGFDFVTLHYTAWGTEFRKTEKLKPANTNKTAGMFFSCWLVRGSHRGEWNRTWTVVGTGNSVSWW